MDNGTRNRGEIKHGPREGAVDAEGVVCECETLTCKVRCACILISSTGELPRGCIPDELARSGVTVVETGTVENCTRESAVDSGIALHNEITGRGEDVLGMDRCSGDSGEVEGGTCENGVENENRAVQSKALACAVGGVGIGIDVCTPGELPCTIGL